jgi:hypothetical protein
MTDLPHDDVTLRTDLEALERSVRDLESKKATLELPNEPPPRSGRWWGAFLTITVAGSTLSYGLTFHHAAEQARRAVIKRDEVAQARSAIEAREAERCAEKADALRARRSLCEANTPTIRSRDPFEEPPFPPAQTRDEPAVEPAPSSRQ